MPPDADHGQLPHLTASAVVLDVTGARTLLIRSNDGHRWTLVGRHVTSGEPAAEAARRALTEQTGLTGFRVIEPHLGLQQDLTDCGTGVTRHVDHVFLIQTDRVHTAADVTDGAAWFAVANLPQPLEPGVGLHVRSAVRELDRH